MIKKTLFISLIAVLLSFQSAIGEDVIKPRSGVIPPSSFSQKSTYYDVGDDESGFSLGIEGGANLNLFAQDMFWQTGPIPAGVTVARSTVLDPTVNSSGISPHLALVMDYSFNRTSAIQARIGYEVKNFQTKGDVQDLTVIGTLSDVEAEFLDFSNWASFALNYRHTFFGGFFATAGVHFDFLAEPIKSEVNITSKNQNVTVTNLLSVYAASQNPDLTLYFKDNYRVTMKGEAKDEIIYKNRTAIDLGLGYQFKIGKHFSIVPQARLQYFITPPIKDQVFNDVIFGTNIPLTTEFKNKRLHTVQFILGLWYNF